MGSCTAPASQEFVQGAGSALEGPAPTLSGGVYTLRQGIETINQCYFEGQDMLFPKVDEGFDDLVEYI